MKTNQLIKLALLPLGLMTSQHVYSHELGGNNSIGDTEIIKRLDLNIDCNEDPTALSQAVEKAYLAKSVQFTVSGVCNGPISIVQSHFEIQNDEGRTGSIRVRHNQEYTQKSAVLVEASDFVLKNINIDVPNHMSAVELKANSLVKFDHVTTNAKSAEDAAFLQFSVTDNSTAYFKNMSGNSIGVYGSSYVEFNKHTDQMRLEIYDTSAGQSTDSNHFKSVQVAGNGYFLADNKSNISQLMIWSKGAAEINNRSRAGEIMMGGQSHFAAYKESTVAGPYSLWGNVVFELEHSKAYNWKAVDKPLSIIIGNNANVNGKLYPGWSWTGQAK
ncbi:hypothetical protein [Pseudoalteromonas luteoviolacea]|uniref:Uncharacterized protein n=1 Tax=Pseudoalteromonas luteoviolacea H33 TaxID=1365251 RepID=A0A167AMD2_9GAMM|nr:hypothetical protein [Pseudoalteromonas luteoviolacea]KZN45574.1 hypothetical protein N476_25455 [Pseudoalteromonas luteoviolacea H33]KZN69547.1 hypothetical protein N477_26235 [Pseudoalteromonas luteoviolacea H33-S]MBQ4880492.1 hypothetical protein [Pseudoalteromonas luteoviolacea]MBQ4909541.1 hypothetical protein [Pseudoalteromonas luteoviolacea]